MSLIKKILNLDTNDKKVTVKNPYYLIDDGVEYPTLELTNTENTSHLKNVVVCIDHDTPTSTSEASERQKKLIEFARKFDLTLNNGTGIGVQLLLEGQVESGKVVLGSGYDISAVGASGALGLRLQPEDLIKAISNNFIEIDVPEVLFVELKGKLPEGVSSKDLILSIIKVLNENDVKGKVIEFYGDGLSQLSKEDYITLCTLASKTNALSAIVNLDNDVVEGNSFKVELNEVKNMVVMPDNYQTITNLNDLGDEVKVKQVFLGGNSGGKITDLRVASEVLKGKKLAYGLRMIIAPVTSKVYAQMASEGLLEIFLDAGCVIMNQGYSADFGKAQGILDINEVSVSAGDNNDKELLIGKNSRIYIVSPLVAAKTAVTGFLRKDL